MFLGQAARLPITVQFGDLEIQVPKFTNRDWIEWVNEIDKARLERATEDLDPQSKFRMLTFYNFLPSTVDEAASWVETLAGAIHVCRTCLSRSRTRRIVLEEGTKEFSSAESLPITPETIQQILEESPATLKAFAKELCDIKDTSKLVPTDNNKDDKGEEKDFDATEKEQNINPLI